MSINKSVSLKCHRARPARLQLSASQREHARNEHAPPRLTENDH